MAHALVLTASSLGRSSQPTIDGVLLLVDGDSVVTIDAWPQPARWVPGLVRLYRGDQEVLSRAPGDELRWMVVGEDRFGTYRAVAIDADHMVASSHLLVRPAPPATIVLPDVHAASEVAAAAPGPSAVAATPAQSVGVSPGPASVGAPEGSQISAPGENTIGAPGPTSVGAIAGPTPLDTAPPGPASPTSGPASDDAAPHGPISLASESAPTEAAPPGSPGSLAGDPDSASSPPAPRRASPTGITPPPAAPLLHADVPSLDARFTAPPAPLDSPIEQTASGAVPGAAAGSVAAAPVAPVPAARPPHAAERGATAQTADVRLPAHASPEDLQALVELPEGEYDGRFAAWVGLVFSVLSVIVLGLVASRLMGDPSWFTAASATSDAADATAITGSPSLARTGTVAERIGLATSTLLIAIGLVLLLAGAALGALEVRARQRRHGTRPPVTRLPGPAVRSLPAILERASQIKATIAVLVAAWVTLLLGVVGQMYWAGQF